jgi:uncharacterized protein DUF5947
VSAGLAALRRFVRRPAAAEEVCELCGAAIPAGHEHLADPVRRELKCACGACAILFPGSERARFVRVRPHAELLPGFHLDDQQWDALRIPVGLAFFFRSSVAGRVVAFYPSPAGATESLVQLDAWSAVEHDNPVLDGLEPDAEALLVHRVGAARDHYRVSIDHCYRLVGLVRLHWRGFSGGAAAWKEIDRFFSGLRGSDA